MEQIKEISLTMVKMIRDRSEMGQLAQFEELLTELVEKGLVKFRNHPSKGSVGRRLQAGAIRK